jgi:hypothetical protein
MITRLSVPKSSFCEAPNFPWVHAMVSCQLPHASLRIFSNSCLDLGDGSISLDPSLFSAPWPWLRSQPSSRSFKTRLQTCCGPRKSCCDSVMHGTSEWWDGRRRDPWQLRPFPPPRLYFIKARTLANQIALFFPSWPPNSGGGRPTASSPQGWRSTPAYLDRNMKNLLHDWNDHLKYLCGFSVLLVGHKYILMFWYCKEMLLLNVTKILFS